MNVNDLLCRSIEWWYIGEYRYRTEIDGAELRLQMNDFPDEPLCTLIIGSDSFDLEEMPNGWRLIK